MFVACLLVHYIIIIHILTIAMSSFRKWAVCILAVTAWATDSNAQTVNNDWVAVPLNNWQSFREPGNNWHIAGDAIADFSKPGDMKAASGEGVAVNITGRKDNSQLVTKEEWGDIELELDFMMAKDANAGVYLEGRYEVQLFDSWTKPAPSFADCGGIYQRFIESQQKGYEGIAPLVNASRAPGLWQHLSVKFRAPRFGQDGRKTADARFEDVYLNGVLVQQQAAVTGPTRSAMYEDEKATGPLMLQGDHGNVAFRNIRYRPLGEPVADTRKPRRVTNPIYITPENRPYLLRSFFNYEGKKRTHIISVGYPSQVNYAYDLKQGALLEVWRGQFLDVTEMWHERGEPQLAVPLGSVLKLSGSPSLAVLPDANAPWPAAIAFDDLQNKGYVLDKARNPTFNYIMNGTAVADKIAAVPGGTSLERNITVESAPAGLYCRVAAAPHIAALDEGMYAIDGRSYYIHIDKRLKPFIRQSGNQQELLVPVPGSKDAVTYSIIW